MILFSVICCISQSITAFSSVAIVVHGTWAQDEVWWRPGGLFFDALMRSPYNRFDDIIPFSWSGHLSHEARELAGYQLALEILKYDEVTIIAHSHGGNVAAVATQYLALWLNQQPFVMHVGYKIKALYLLGTPIRTACYMPDMTLVGYVYNLFSFEDMVQPVLGLFERVFPLHKRIANLSVYIEGQAPGHTQFQIPLVAYDLCGIHELLQNDYEPLGFEKFSFLQAGSLYFTYARHVAYDYEYDRLRKLEFDKKLQQQLLQYTIRGMYQEGMYTDMMWVWDKHSADLKHACALASAELGGYA